MKERRLNRAQPKSSSTANVEPRLKQKMMGEGAGRMWARSIEPKFLEISVQNSRDLFSSTGKVSKKLVHFLRWTTFPGWIGWNLG